MNDMQMLANIAGMTAELIESGKLVRVVRCIDCKWWHESETHKGYGDCGQANGIALKSSDWFCADGIRRDGNA